MQTTPTVFKAYDIRGMYPEEINEDFAERLGRAFVSYLHEHAPHMLNGREVVVGRDARISGPALYDALARGIMSVGVDVLNVGMIATEQLYYGCGSLHRPGIIVSASHNPKEYNGFKMVGEIPLVVRGEEMRAAFEAGQFFTAGPPGRERQTEIMKGYVQKVRSFVKEELLLPLSLVVDTGNGMGGPAVEAAFEGLPFQMTKMFFNPDGAFPNRSPDPLQPENRRMIEKRVREERADLGFSFDGDADRCFVIDDEGQMIPGDFLFALLAQAVLKDAPQGARVIHDVRASWAVIDAIRVAGGVPVMERVGHAFIKPRMKQEQAIFGGEVTGHYYYRDFYYSDSGIITALKVCELASRSGKTMSELLLPFKQKYFLSGEINFRVENARGVMEQIAARYADAIISRLDGISCEYPDWHFNIRSSNTEPLVRLNLEARSQSLMEQKRDEVLKIIET